MLQITVVFAHEDFFPQGEARHIADHVPQVPSQILEGKTSARYVLQDNTAVRFLRHLFNLLANFVLRENTRT